MAKHAVITRERVAAEWDGSKRVSLKCKADIDNGNIVVLGDKLPGERELYDYSIPTASTKLDEIVILGTPEVMADERKKNISDFYNEVGQPMDGDMLEKTNYVGLTEEAFGGTPVVGEFVEIEGGSTKLKPAATDANAVGKIVDLYNGKYGVQFL